MFFKKHLSPATVLSIAFTLLLLPRSLHATDQLLVEAESFQSPSGWMLDTQFITEMGSPYLLAHGMGSPVADATTEVTFPSTGTYRAFVRTKNWVARWGAGEGDSAPGKFQLHINGSPLTETFGTKGKDWFWHDGGTVEITDLNGKLALHDLTGFEGRCDAVFFTKDTEASPPPNDSTILSKWRRDLLGLPEEPIIEDGFDLVVVGGGYSGMGAAISAARMGCKVALIQNRPVLGGNGSSEVRVWAMGNIRRGKYPRIGEIVDEFADSATKSPGRADEFGDDLKEKTVRAEQNIKLFLNHHAYAVKTDEGHIDSVTAFDTRTSEHRTFKGRNFVDCTGHGTIGFLANADWEMTPKGRMGMSNMWVWDEVDVAKGPTTFPDTPWALDLYMDDFPYPRDHHGQWFWEGGFDKDPLGDAEGIRDWNFRAVYGAFNAMKNRDGKEKHAHAVLKWIAFIGGPRESRRLHGDVVLTQDDVVNKREFPDGCVPTTWSIDLHYPKEEFAKKYPDNPFISKAVHDRRIDRSYGYPVPYRCFYSRNVDNLFIAGRCASVTHEALGTVRVMKTCGMMGEVVGKAASICAARQCSPREVYEKYLSELKENLELPGLARRTTPGGEVVMPEKLLPSSPYGPNGKEERNLKNGIKVETLDGIVADNHRAKLTGKWTEGAGLKGYVGRNYVYASPEIESTIKFVLATKIAGEYELRLAYLSHENRGDNVPVNFAYNRNGVLLSTDMKINMKQPAPIDGKFISVGTFSLLEGEVCTVTLSSKDAGGLVHADAVQLLPVEKEE